MHNNIRPEVDRGRGRGPQAVEDMRKRIAALKASGKSSEEVFSLLWDRNREAVTGDGYTYEYAEAVSG